jgi:DNA repair protein RecO (recombination protein O)
MTFERRFAEVSTLRPVATARPLNFKAAILQPERKQGGLQVDWAMSEKAQAIVIRQADFSESSRVITLFSKEFGKFAVLAKGAKRLKGPFDAALDLLSKCRVVFLRKSTGALSLLTQADLVRRFAPAPGSLNSLYGGYYVADLLCGLTEDFDPAPEVFDLTDQCLQKLMETTATSAADANRNAAVVVVQFEIQLLVNIGLFPDLRSCCVCGAAVELDARFAHWVSQGGLLCSDCRRQEYAGRSVSGGTVSVLRQLSESSGLAGRLRMTTQQVRECHQLAVSAITNTMGRKPGTLRYLNFPD